MGPKALVLSPAVSEGILLVSWNVAGRVKVLEQQAERVLGLHADLVCLQEVTPRTLPLWREHLRGAGFEVREASTPERAKHLLVLSASRVPMRAVEVAEIPWPERVLATRLRGGLEVVNVHSPISPKPELAKVRTHLAVHRHLARPSDHPRILCGDLNTPRAERADGTVWTFARDRYGRLRSDRGEEWDRAELALIRGLAPYGFSDAFRELHGYERREISWGWQRWSGGYRLDHLIVSGVSVTECRYEHRWRADGLSDHSALIARIHARRAREAAR